MLQVLKIFNMDQVLESKFCMVYKTLYYTYRDQCNGWVHILDFLMQSYAKYKKYSNYSNIFLFLHKINFVSIRKKNQRKFKMSGFQLKIFQCKIKWICFIYHFIIKGEVAILALCLLHIMSITYYVY